MIALFQYNQQTYQIKITKEMIFFWGVSTDIFFIILIKQVFHLELVYIDDIIL